MTVSGGQKEVCRAKHNGDDVILKLIKANVSSDVRTEREIAAVGKLQSKYVPAILEVGNRVILGVDRQYIIEQFIDGCSYRSVLQQTPKQTLRKVIELCLVLLEAAADFESKSIVHRDIKPENLLVGLDGKLWVIDFGLARHLDLVSITPNGPWGVGTLGYAPPEQFRNLKTEIDARTDLYSIGIVVYESLHGLNPYLNKAANGVEVIQRMDTQDLPALVIIGDASNAFSDFIACLTQRFPSRRPQTAAEALKWFLPIYKSLKT